MYGYILSSGTRRLYVGVTNDLVRRVWEHKEGVIPGFTKRFGIKRLVYYEAILAEPWWTNAKRADFSLRSK